MTGDAQALGSSLAPVVREACGGRLNQIEWFRCVWQTGGAATGFGTWTDNACTQPALVKIPVGPTELRWTVALGESGRVTPKVLAWGDRAGGYDLAWIVTERLDGQPLSQRLDQNGVRDIIEACADFHQEASAVRGMDETPKRHDWEKAVHDSRECVRTHALAEAPRWNEALRKAQKALPVIVARWEGRQINTWCHGDLHPGNALPRISAHGTCAPRPCVLIDLALVHPGHWLEDALYLERQFWGHEERLHGVKPVSALAQVRRSRGLPTGGDYGELAIARRVLMAAVVPLFIDREHNARYTHAALEVLEKFLPQVH